MQCLSPGGPLPAWPQQRGWCLDLLVLGSRGRVGVPGPTHQACRTWSLGQLWVHWLTGGRVPRAGTACVVL